MRWTVQYFRKQENDWATHEMAIQDGGLEGDGLRSYAAKQTSMWGLMATQAQTIFAGCAVISVI
jgi:hypothetical protein